MMAVYWDSRLRMTDPIMPLGEYDRHEKRLCDQALFTQYAPGEVLRQTVRPPLAQVPFLPPRYGYDRSVPGVRDVLSEGRDVVTFAEDFSGSVGGYAGSSVNTGYSPLG